MESRTLGDLGEVGTLGEILAQHAAGVLDGSRCPGTLGIAEVDLQSGVDADRLMGGHLGALVPGQSTPQLPRQSAGQKVRPTILEAHQHEVAALTLNQGADLPAVAGPTIR